MSHCINGVAKTPYRLLARLTLLSVVPVLLIAGCDQASTSIKTLVLTIGSAEYSIDATDADKKITFKDDGTVTLKVPDGTTEVTVKTITLDGGTSTTKTGNLALTGNKATIKVTSADSTTTKTYTLTFDGIAPLNSAKDITALTLTVGDASAASNGTWTMVTTETPGDKQFAFSAGNSPATTLTLARGSDLANTTVAIGNITVSDNAVANPDSGTVTFSDPANDMRTATITVRAQDGTLKIYTINLAVTQSPENDILALTLKVGSASATSKEIWTMVTTGTPSDKQFEFSADDSPETTLTLAYDLNALATTTVSIGSIDVSDDARAPAVDTNITLADPANDMRTGTIVVTAQDKSTKTYTIKIAIAEPSSGKDLTTLIINVSGAAVGNSNGNWTMIRSGQPNNRDFYLTNPLFMDKGTDLNAITVTIVSIIVSDNAEANPDSGSMTLVDDTSQGTLDGRSTSITVTAQDGETKVYTIHFAVLGRS